MLYARNQNIVAAVLVYVAAWGFSATASAAHLEDIQADLDTHRQAWQSLNIDQYTYHLQRICFCQDPYTSPGIVHVSNGEITSVEHALTGDPLPVEIFLTADALFTEIEKGIEAHADNIVVEYDPSFGYPTALDIDFLTELADEEVSFRASELVVIPEPSCRALLLWAFTSLGFRKLRWPAIS
jgi:hypothetical protein